jgi:hypothetical protein
MTAIAMDATTMMVCLSIILSSRGFCLRDQGNSILY